jgi:hypothetical protein
MQIWNIKVIDTIWVEGSLWLIKWVDTITWHKHLYIGVALWIDEDDDIKHIIELWHKYQWDEINFIINRMNKW